MALQREVLLVEGSSKFFPDDVMLLSVRYF